MVDKKYNKNYDDINDKFISNGNNGDEYDDNLYIDDIENDEIQNIYNENYTEFVLNNFNNNNNNDVVLDNNSTSNECKERY